MLEPRDRRRLKRPYMWQFFAFLAVLAVAGSAAWAIQKWGNQAPESIRSALPATAASAANVPAQDLTQTASPTPVEPVMRDSHGVRYQADPLVVAFLNQSVRCLFMHHETDGVATVFDLLRLRGMGLAALPPFEYEVLHEADGGHDFVVVRERLKGRNGADYPGAPGFVVHRYYFDDARERFDLVRSSPEDPSFSPRILKAIGDPMGILARQVADVCWERDRVLKVEGAWEPAAVEGADREGDVASPQAPGPSTSVSELLNREADLDEKCRGGAGIDPATNAACEKRNAVEDQLAKSGMCYGHKGENGSQMSWHRCGPRSCHVGEC